METGTPTGHDMTSILFYFLWWDNKVILNLESISSHPLTSASDEVAISSLAKVRHSHGMADDAGYPTLHVWTQLKASALTQPLQNLERTEVTNQFK